MTITTVIRNAATKTTAMVPDFAAATKNGANIRVKFLNSFIICAHTDSFNAFP